MATACLDPAALKRTKTESGALSGEEAVKSVLKN